MPPLRNKRGDASWKNWPVIPEIFSDLKKGDITMKKATLISLVACLIIFGFGFATQKDQIRPDQPTLELKVEGGEAVLLRGKDAGLPLEKLPGIKSITFEQWLKMEKIPVTGLFLVDTDFIPTGLPEFLKEHCLVLKKDGTLLDSDGMKIALFLQGEVFKVKMESKSLSSHATAAKGPAIFSASADPANPYPFSMFSWYMWWKYRGGFCRDYRAGTVAEAWGPEQGGARPHTRIEYIETRVAMAGRSDRDSCMNCDYKNSYVRWNIGCFWPAHGKASGWHYANWKDGSFSATRTWSWSH